MTTLDFCESINTIVPLKTTFKLMKEFAKIQQYRLEETLTCDRRPALFTKLAVSVYFLAFVVIMFQCNVLSWSMLSVKL